VLFPLASILRLASVIICLIVIASFGLFAINRTSSASAHQQRVLSGEANAPAGSGAATSSAHQGSVRAAIDDASNALTSPFSGATTGSSEWVSHVVRLALALAVYGFGLSFVARVIRVRV
jgi:hypothetical protein